MNALAQFKLGAADLEVLLAVSRSRTLAQAGERLGLDASTVFRTLRRLERGLGERLFDRSRGGYVALESTQSLIDSAEQIEAALDAARSSLEQQPALVSGTVRITTTDSVLHSLLAPQLPALRRLHPLLQYELHCGNELASLTRRDADIAVRATRAPPQHLIGKRIGPIRVALFVAKHGPVRSFAQVETDMPPWIAPDDALPEHPSVLWRKRRFPKAVTHYRVNSILTVFEFVTLGLGVGVLPLFLAEGRDDLIDLSGPLDDCITDLWLLADPRSRHLRRVSSVFGHLARTLVLD